MDLQNAPPASLAELIEPEVEPRRVWLAHELGEVLAHELSMPLRLELGELPPDGEDAVTAAAAAAGRLAIGGLLHHPDPPLELLVRLKRFAKAAGGDPQGHLPEDVAGVLYAMAIAAALVRHGRRITSMTDRALGDYLAWAAGRRWLDGPGRQLLSEAAATLAAGGAARGAPGRPASPLLATKGTAT
jgi:hypothetical protein